MIKKLTALAALVLLLLTQRPHAQGPAGAANIYFVDIGQGASTLVVSPTGKTLLVDGGADGSATKIAALMTTLGITTIDYTVVTHYHIDHISGITELINGGKVHGTAFDNGDGADVQPPGTSTSPASTRGHYLDYKSAILAHPEVTRATVMPGTPDSVLDLGGGMRATFLAAGGRLLSGGQAAITNADLNSESISVLVELNNFDYLVSGDLTGGGSTATAKTPDVETYVAQMVGDVDVVQLDHHGSTTANNQTFLAALKAEVAFAQTGENNMFGHPNRETANKYLNTPTTGGNSFAGTDVPPALGIGPVFYQNEASPSGDDRVTHQGYTGAAAGHAGQGTILLSTDGTTTYSLSSVDDGGARLNATAHTYPVDGASPGLTIDFKPTVQAQTAPVLPAAGQSVIVSAAVNDRESSISSVVLNYSLAGSAQSPIAMTFTSGAYQATIPGQPDGTRVDYAIAAAAGGQTTTYSSGYFSGVTPISSIRDLNAAGEPLYAGYAARIQGMVTASGYSSGTNDDYVQDATGGVNVYRSTDTPTPFTSTSPGQLVLAFGRIGFNGGRLRLDLTESLEKTTSPYGVTVLAANPPPTPVTMTIAAINANPESFEGQFVSISNCTIVSGSIPATPQPVDVRDDFGRHRQLRAESRSRHRRRGVHAGADVHRHRHHPAGRFSAAVRLGLRHRSTQPQRSRRRRAGAANAADDRRRAHRSDQQRRRHTRRGLHPRSPEPGRARARHSDVDRFSRLQRHRVLRAGRDRRHRSVQHVAERRALRDRRHRRSHRCRHSIQRADGVDGQRRLVHRNGQRARAGRGDAVAAGERQRRSVRRTTDPDRQRRDHERPVPGRGLVGQRHDRGCDRYGHAARRQRHEHRRHRDAGYGVLGDRRPRSVLGRAVRQRLSAAAAVAHRHRRVRRRRSGADRIARHARVSHDNRRQRNRRAGQHHEQRHDDPYADDAVHPDWR